jgi:hypothetical protein
MPSLARAAQVVSRLDRAGLGERVDTVNAGGDSPGAELLALVAELVRAGDDPDCVLRAACEGAGRRRGIGLDDGWGGLTQRGVRRVGPPPLTHVLEAPSGQHRSSRRREILDSRGNPTVEVEVALDDGTIARAAVPRAPPPAPSRPTRSATVTRSRYLGKGVEKAVDAVLDEINPKIMGFDASEQRLIDAEMIALDGTKNKENLGANAILGVSLAVARAAADSAGLPLFRYVGGPTRTSCRCR